jgi:hypothetical protein
MRIFCFLFRSYRFAQPPAGGLDPFVVAMQDLMTMLRRKRPATSIRIFSSST